MKFECAGKLILLGEYSVITGGPCLVAAIPPAFSVEVTPTTSGGIAHPFAAASPAGLLISGYQKKYPSLNGKITWHDPYTTPIGVGSSSAQFVLVMRALHSLLDIAEPSAEDCLQRYWEVVGTTQGIRPSGVDVVSQLSGGVILFKNEPFYLERQPTLKENRMNALFLLAFTGSKMRTHEHLLRLRDQGFPLKFDSMLRSMNDITLRGVNAWRTGQTDAFGECMNRYQDIMNAHNLSNEPVIEKITKARHWEGVIGCKGSGAQGGDSALFLVQPEKAQLVRERIAREGWTAFDVSL